LHSINRIATLNTMQRILIVEDDQILREMYQDQFKKNGYEVTTGANGEEGLELALQLHPNLILLDLALPAMDGTTMMEKLRDDAWGKDVAIIILTNLNVDGDLLNKMIQNRPAYCLMKVGVTPEEVMAKAQGILKPV